MKTITKFGFIASMVCASFSFANAAVPAVAPPVPTYTTENAWALFADTYRDDVYATFKDISNWGGGIGSFLFKATGDEMETVMQISGMNNETGYLAIQLNPVPTNIKANAYTYMHLDIFCSEATYFRFGMETWTPLTTSAMKIYAPTIKPTDMVPGKWYSIDYPMADFGGIPNGGLNILRFGNTELLEETINAADVFYSGEIYIANFYFFNGEATCLGGKVIGETGLINPVDQYSFNAYVSNNYLKCSATESIKKLEIFSVTGQKVQSEQNNDLTANTNISSLSSGVYFVSAELSNGAIVSKRFIK
jgi:hypothetical protein